MNVRSDFHKARVIPKGDHYLIFTKLRKEEVMRKESHNQISISRKLDDGKFVLSLFFSSFTR